MSQSAKYRFQFEHNIPTYESLSWEKTGRNESYHELYIMMEVYSNDKIIYSIELNMEGHYYCCGSRNFDYDIIAKTIIQPCDLEIDDMNDELENNCKNIFRNTVLKHWTSHIFTELRGD
jgi:hypothetical protein